MKDKQLLRVFIVLTTMPFIVAGIATAMNFLLSCVFMCDFKEIQVSAIWILHIIVGFFFTVMLLSDE